jgi:hypothetical protein
VRRTRAFFWAFGVPRWAFGVRRTKGILLGIWCVAQGHFGQFGATTLIWAFGHFAFVFSSEAFWAFLFSSFLIRLS